MRLLLPFLTLSTIVAQVPKSLADTERAFARMAQERGTSPAFSAFFASDGIVFKPRPTSAHAVHDGKPDDGSRLQWEPEFAAVSGSEDLGWTTGPWTWRQQAADAKPAAHGHFVSVWRKQADGTWKVALDLGISHPAPPPAVFSQAPALRAAPLSKTALEGARRTMLATEERFRSLASAKGAAAALEALAAQDLRTYRQGLLPALSKPAGLAMVAVEGPTSQAALEGCGVSSAGDLGYAYGLVSQKTASAPEPLPFTFLRVWRKASKTWQVVLDLQIPAPSNP